VSRRLLTFAVLLYFMVGLGAVVALYTFRAPEALAPEQPIAFSHVIHAGKLGLACTHCHVNVERSSQATVPTLSICMECHKSAATDRPEVQKLTRAWEEGRPVEWIKVHDLPWHVRFTHKRHIRAGVDCAVCHGELKAMPRVRRVRSLEMGWCIQCHRANNAPTDCLVCHK